MSHGGFLCPMVDFYVPWWIFVSHGGFLCPMVYLAYLSQNL